MRIFRPDWYKDVKPFSCEPLSHLLPQQLDFDVIGAKGGLPDHFWSVTLEPYSSALTDLVRETGVAHEEVAATLWDMRSKNLISRDYCYLHIMNCIEAVDFDRTSADVLVNREGRPFLTKIQRLILREDVVGQAIPIFRLAEAKDLILVHKDFKAAYEDRNLCGSEFIPLP